MAPRNFDTFDPASLQQTEDDIITTHFPTSQPVQVHPVPQEDIVLDDEKKDFKPQIVWKNVAIFTYLHIAAIYGVYLCAYAKYQTLIFGKKFFKKIFFFF